MDDKPKLSQKQIWQLIWQTYKATFPYVMVFILALLAGTWLVTEVFLRS